MGGGFFGERKDVYDDWYPGIDQMFFPVETTPIDRLIVESTGKKNPTVLVITTASEGGERDVDLYMSAFRKQYEPIGAKIEELRLIQQEETHEEIVAKIGRADAVYVTPGDTSLLIKTWRKRGVDELLRVAYESGTVMSGLSAGACCWFDFFLPDKQEGAVDKQTALGWVQGLLCVHFNTEADTSSFKSILKKDTSLFGIALDEHAAIEIVDDEYRIHTYSKDSFAWKCYWNNGEYIVEKLREIESFSSIKNLKKC